MITTTYTPTQLRSVLKQVGLVIDGETGNDFQCFCPYHNNRYSPAMSVSKTKGTFICFSPECARTGTVLDLIKRAGNLNEYQAMRMLANAGKMSNEDFLKELDNTLTEPEELPEFSQAMIDKLKKQFWQLPDARAYMNGRGFNDDTLEEFDFGYSVKKGLVTVPLYDQNGRPLGLVGRSITGKQFKNSPALPKSKAVFNLQRAKRGTGVAIVSEASFDVAATYQEGFTGGVALLGGTLSKEQIYLLDRYFHKIIIMTDMDDKTKHIRFRCSVHHDKCTGHNPGRDLGNSIAKALPHKDIWWAHSGTESVYFGGVKDATDMIKTPGQIAACIENAIPNYEYQMLGIY